MHGCGLLIVCESMTGTPPHMHNCTLTTEMGVSQSGVVIVFGAWKTVALMHSIHESLIQYISLQYQVYVYLSVSVVSSYLIESANLGTRQ